MRDIFIGLVIILVCFLLIDFISTEKNTCEKVEYNGAKSENYKCGILKNNLDLEIDLFNRYW